MTKTMYEKYPDIAELDYAAQVLEAHRTGNHGANQDFRNRLAHFLTIVQPFLPGAW